MKITQIFAIPHRRDWIRSALAFVGFAGIATTFGLASGLYTYAPITDPAVLVRFSAIAFVTPGILEELAFRGPLVWLAMTRGRAPAWAIALSLLLFILWHPFNATVYLIEAQDLFFDWRFLAVAAGIGVVATWLALRAQSLWPAIIFHWLAVTGWKAFLGAPQFF